MQGLFEVKVTYYPDAAHALPDTEVFLAGGMEFEAMYRRFGPKCLEDPKQQHTALAFVAFEAGKRAGVIDETFEEWRAKVGVTEIEGPGESQAPPAT